MTGERVTFDRKEFLEFLEWVGVTGEISKTDGGQESFNLVGNFGNTFTLDVSEIASHSNHQSERDRVLDIPDCKVPEGVLLKLCGCGNDTFRFVETADWIVEIEQWEGDELLKICTRCGKTVACISDMKNGKSISRGTLAELRGKQGEQP